MSQNTQEVTLAQILQAREDRVYMQQELLRQFRCPVICFTMNIAGPVKNSPLIRRGFREGLHTLEAQLPADCIRAYREDISVTGCQAMYAVSMDAAELKKICTGIEERTPLGRLFDMDVLDVAGSKLERSNPRSCLVCGTPGRVCAAGRLHTVAQLQAVTTQILREHFIRTDAPQIASLAVQSLIDEVYTTPKPGLVDRRNCGSHRDMEIGHFLASAKALKPYFEECVRIGIETASCPPQETFPPLRQAGLIAEETMFRTTGGINTHKGAIYTLGVLCGSIGRLWKPESPLAASSAIAAECARVVRDSAPSDLAAADGSTAGLRFYREYGLRGIRGEAAEGLPSVMKIALPAYEKGLRDGFSPNDAGAAALLHLIANVSDTNLYKRGGPAGAVWAAESARRLLQASAYPSIPAIEELDDAFIARNLSPGGCADLLAVTYFLHSIQSEKSGFFSSDLLSNPNINTGGRQNEI